MIDSVYHNEWQTEMTERVSQREKAPERVHPERFSENPAVRELLDHLAEELAKEYINLMQASAERPANEEGK